MQVENAAEWAKREQISSEKHSLERENKKLKAIVEDLQDEVRKKHTGLSSAKDQDIKTLQDELSNRNKVGQLSSLLNLICWGNDSKL